MNISYEIMVFLRPTFDHFLAGKEFSVTATIAHQQRNNSYTSWSSGELQIKRQSYLYGEDVSHLIGSEAEDNEFEQGGSALWRERWKRAQGIKMGRIVTKFSISQNK